MNDALAPRMSYNDGPNSRPSLHVEDRAWIAALYPKTGVAPTTGTIRGRVLLPDGKTGLQGIQVVARQDGDEEVTAVSGVSGYLYKDPHGLGSRDPAPQGFYQLPGLPPGNYRLSIEQLDDDPEVGPRHAFLPGGRRFFRDTGPLAVQRQDATLISVGTGQVVEGRDFVLDGSPQPLREVRESEPNGSLEMVQTLALPADVTGRVSTQDFKIWTLSLPGRRRDTVEDWFHVVVTEQTTLSATLTATNADADVNLYLVSDPDARGQLEVWERSSDPGTPPETFQIRVPAGVYFVGVSANDATGSPDSDYRLTVSGTPAPDPAAASSNAPKITLAVISNLTPGGFRVSWQTDQDANAVLYVWDPQRELGSPSLTRDHAFDVTGLAAGTNYVLEVFSRNADVEIDRLPALAVSTAVAASGASPRLLGGLWSAVPQDEKNQEFLLIARLSNSGDGPASGVQIDQLALPSGWRFDGTPTLPIDLGQIGRGAVVVVAARVTRTADAAAPLDLILQGSYASIDGAARFSFGR